MGNKKVVDFLQRGKNHAIPMAELAKRMGLPNTRSLRLLIEAERRGGAVILSSSSPHGGGYYLPGSEAEIDEFIAEMSARCRTTYQLLKSAKRFKRLHMSGQYYVADMADKDRDAV